MRAKSKILTFASASETDGVIRWVRSREPVNPPGNSAAAKVYEVRVEGSGQLMAMKEVSHSLFPGEKVRLPLTPSSVPEPICFKVG
jgi:hypothetical protein